MMSMHTQQVVGNMDMLFGIVITFFMGVFALYSCVIVEEQKRGEKITLPWEKNDE